MRPTLLWLVLAALPSFASRPLEPNVSKDAVGVLVRFLGISKTDAQARLDAVAEQQQLSGALRIGFLKTQASSLAIVYVVGPGALTLSRLKGLAAACSAIAGATAAYAYFYPGLRNSALEAEGYWHYEAGRLVTEKQLAFRDDRFFVQWTQKQISRAELSGKKWPHWPLSELTRALGLPGRDFLERPLGLLEVAASGFPRDVGENLVLSEVHLPVATLFEIRQSAERENASLSKVVQDALVAAEADEKFGAQLSVSGGAESEEPSHDFEKGWRPLELFLTRPWFNKLDGRSEGSQSNLSMQIEAAWRQAHPLDVPKKTR